MCYSSLFWPWKSVSAQGVHLSSATIQAFSTSCSSQWCVPSFYAVEIVPITLRGSKVSCFAQQRHVRLLVLANVICIISDKQIVSFRRDYKIKHLQNLMLVHIREVTKQCDTITSRTVLWRQHTSHWRDWGTEWEGVGSLVIFTKTWTFKFFVSFSTGGL